MFQADGGRDAAQPDTSVAGSHDRREDQIRAQSNGNEPMTTESRFQHTGRMIREEIRIEAPPDQVYRAWTDPTLLTSWFIGRMDGLMDVGETVTWGWENQGPGMRQRVLVAEPPRRLVTAMELPLGPSLLEVAIEPDGQGSIVRLVQSGYGEGPDWDAEYQSMISGWMIALAVLRYFAKRYFGRPRREIVILADASFHDHDIVALQRSEDGLARWLTRSGEPGKDVGEPVRLVLPDGKTLTGSVLRNTSTETLWSWNEIEGVVEIKAFRGARWGSKVGVRVSSWLETASDLVGMEDWLESAVAKLAALLADGGA